MICFPMRAYLPTERSLISLASSSSAALPPVRSMWRVAKPSTAMEMSSLSAQKRSQVSSSSSGPDEWWSARVGRTSFPKTRMARQKSGSGTKPILAATLASGSCVVAEAAVSAQRMRVNFAYTSGLVGQQRGRRSGGGEGPRASVCRHRMRLNFVTKACLIQSTMISQTQIIKKACETSCSRAAVSSSFWTKTNWTRTMSRYMDRLKRSTASAQETWKRFSASHRLKTFVLSSVKLFEMRRVSSTFEFELMATERATAW
mmetsp:Transcript_34470/g.111153  ORF Transcript_34470/g.111153 Transcript_34470/m.111153 type:complete len:259 (-) Transcript_34470:1096-1872(-)